LQLFVALFVFVRGCSFVGLAHSFSHLQVSQRIGSDVATRWAALRCHAASSTPHG
jgi:hypothetical protein